MSKELSSAIFESDVLTSEKPVLVDFWATWCGPCKALSPIIEEIGDEMADRIDTYKCNADDEPDLLQRFGIMSIPTMILFKGGEPAMTLVGNKPKAEIIAAIEAAL